ncbi:MAG: LTA synthase family protein [Dokdonella sp.]
MDRLFAIRRHWSNLEPATRLTLALLGSVAVLLLLIDQLDPAFAWTNENVHATSLFNLLLLNALPLVALLLMLLALTRRVALSIWLTALLGFALFAANSAKLSELQTPLLPSDFRFLAEPGPALALFAHYLKFNLVTFVSLLAVVVIVVLLVRRRGSATLVGWRRAVLAVIAFALAISLIAGSPPWRQLYSSKRMGFEPWALTESAARAGLIGSLLLYHWELGDGRVPTADRDAAIAMIDAHADLLRERLAAATTTQQPPDIVIVQSESLFDPARLNNVEPGRFLTEFRKLAKSSRSGELHVPTFGGGSIRTEFELLTGAPLSSLGGIQYPWLELDHARFPSLASILARNGYTTTAIHPNGAAFWNRNRVFPELGFQRFIDVAAFKKEDIVGLFTSDAALTDYMIAELKDDGPPQFLFAITMENHGPFDWRPNLDAERLAALPMPPQLDDGGRLWFGNYLYLLDDADHELGRLAEALKQRKRRTLLLFFGDHLPSIHTVYNQLGFDDGKTELEQPTEWLLFDPANPRGVQENTQTWLLPTRLLDSAGIANEPYFIVTAALRDALNIDGEPITPEQAKAFNALAQLQLRGELDGLLRERLGTAAPTHN